MKNKRSKQRQGRPGDIAKLDFHDWGGGFLNRIKAKNTEKKRGMYMISLLMEFFNINIEDYKIIAAEELIAEAYEQRGLIAPPIKIKRDEDGNIVSPFASKTKLI